MHSEIHLRWANWVEPDFPSCCFWQTRGHPRDRAAQAGILQEVAIRGRAGMWGCGRLGTCPVAAVLSHPRGGHDSKSIPTPLLPHSVNGQSSLLLLRPRTRLWLIFLSLTSCICSIRQSHEPRAQNSEHFWTNRSIPPVQPWFKPL